MKRLALAAFVLSIAACTAKDETPADSTMAAPAMAPAPAAPVDSAAMMMPMDSTKPMDTTMTPPPPAQ